MILVTGSSGHLGEALVRLLRSQGQEVCGLDVLPSEFTDIVGSIVDPQVCQSAIRDVTAILHTATLHKPHIATHSKQDFIDVNISGTLNLLEAAVQSKTVKAFVFTSTTSAFGDSLKSKKGEATWIDESVPSDPKNIYGVTKTAAEDLCLLFAKLYQLPCVVLRVSRFFPEDDDNENVRQEYKRDNAQALELLHRRADIFDMATAHVSAIDYCQDQLFQAQPSFDRFIITADNPFTRDDLQELAIDAPAVIQRYFPTAAAAFAKMNWKFYPRFDRVYRNDRAREKLGWVPKYSFEHVLDRIGMDQETQFWSELAQQVGKKGYHRGRPPLDDDDEGDKGPYPVDKT